MVTRRAVLGAGNVDGRGIEMDLLPAQSNQFTNPQRMPEGHEDQQPIADRIAALTRGGDQLVDLAFRQILALPIISVLGPTIAGTISVSNALAPSGALALMSRTRSTNTRHSSGSKFPGVVRCHRDEDVARQKTVSNRRQLAGIG